MTCPSPPQNLVSTFRYTYLFDAALLTWIHGWNSLTAGGPCDDVTRSTVGTVSRSWLRNQDYHWYHYKGTGAAAIQLVAEVEALTALFVTTGLNADVGTPIGVSVCESGASVNHADIVGVRSGDYTYWANVVDNDAIRTAVVDSVMYPFQAIEVWRRLATALCVGSRAAWHDHMSSTLSGKLPFPAAPSPPPPPDEDSGAFRDMGVREDQNLDSTAVASMAGQRPAWWAYQRLAKELGTSASDGTRYWQGRVISRPTDPGNYYQGTATSPVLVFRSDPRNMVVVLGFYLVAPDAEPPMHRHAYVLFLDPELSYTYDRYLPRPAAVVDFTNRHRGAVGQLPTVPDTFTPGSPGTATEFPEDNFPAQGTWAWNDLRVDPSSGNSTGSVTLVVGDPPILLLSEGVLEFTS